MGVPYTFADKGGQLVGASELDSNFNFITSSFADAGLNNASYLAPLAGATQRGSNAKFGDIASVKDFGAAGDGVTDDTAALARAQAWYASATAPILYFPEGIYVYSVSPNWALQDGSVPTFGNVILRYTGTGNAVIVDAGSGSQNVFDMQMGPFIVQAPSTAMNGVYVRAIHHSSLAFNVRGAGATYAGLHVDFAVCTQFPKFICSSTDSGLGMWYLGAKPQYGMWLDERNAGELTSYCVFDNPVIEHVDTGAYLNNAIGNQFYGGTMESCTNIGANLQAGALENKFFGTDFEANTNYDVYCAGYDNEFYGIDSLSLTTLASGATRNRFFGGSFQSINLAAGSTKNLLSGVTWNRLNTSGTLIDSGVSNSISGCSSPSSAYFGRPPVRTPLSVTASPYTYSNTIGDPERVLITGGTVSSLGFTHAGTLDTIAYTPGALYSLNPGDSLTVTYSVAPTMILYS